MRHHQAVTNNLLIESGLKQLPVLITKTSIDLAVEDAIMSEKNPLGSRKDPGSLVHSILSRGRIAWAASERRHPSGFY